MVSYGGTLGLILFSRDCVAKRPSNKHRKDKYLYVYDRKVKSEIWCSSERNDSKKLLVYAGRLFYVK